MPRASSASASPPPAAPPGAAADSAEDEGIRRAHQLLLLLTMAALLSGLLTALWLAVLRLGARVFVYAGAMGSALFGLANGCWLLAQVQQSEEYED